MKDDRVSPLVKYDFINDRLRSVKQDGVIQRLPFEDWFRILPSIVRFYAFSAYWYDTNVPIEVSNNLPVSILNTLGTGKNILFTGIVKSRQKILIRN